MINCTSKIYAEISKVIDMLVWFNSNVLYVAKDFMVFGQSAHFHLRWRLGWHTVWSVGVSRVLRW